MTYAIPTFKPSQGSSPTFKQNPKSRNWLHGTKIWLLLTYLSNFLSFLFPIFSLSTSYTRLVNVMNTTKPFHTIGLSSLANSCWFFRFQFKHGFLKETLPGLCGGGWGWGRPFAATDSSVALYVVFYCLSSLLDSKLHNAGNSLHHVQY